MIWEFFTVEQVAYIILIFGAVYFSWKNGYEKGVKLGVDFTLDKLVDEKVIIIEEGENGDYIRPGTQSKYVRGPNW